jgi:hypothetical protein
METGKQASMKRGDRVAAATDLETTNGFRVAEGTQGVVAEDRGSSLVVFFEDGPIAASLDENDLNPA